MTMNTTITTTYLQQQHSRRKCLVEENLYIRRKVCECEDTNPGKVEDGSLNDSTEVR